MKDDGDEEGDGEEDGEEDENDEDALQVLSLSEEEDEDDIFSAFSRMRLASFISSGDGVFSSKREMQLSLKDSENT